MTSFGLERLRGRVAFVTGASSGIGRAVCERLLAAGLRVAACARRVERVRQIAASDDLLPLAADLRQEADILAAFAAVRARWGGTDIVINNAGLGHHAPLSSGDTDHWREMLDVNVLAACVCTREALADMRRSGIDGHVLFVSSMVAHRVPADSALYSATKFAIRALTEALRQELRAAKSPVRVSAVSPGYVQTEFAAKYHKSEAAAEVTYGAYPVLQPDDVAAAVEYALGQPPHVQIHDVLMRPTDQTS